MAEAADEAALAQQRAFEVADGVVLRFSQDGFLRRGAGDAAEEQKN
jgi:hypothetical protein